MGSNLLCGSQEVPGGSQVFPLDRSHSSCYLVENRSIGVPRRDCKKSAITKPLGHGLREPFKLGPHLAVGMSNMENVLHILAGNRVSCLRQNLPRL